MLNEIHVQHNIVFVGIIVVPSNTMSGKHMVPATSEPFISNFLVLSDAATSDQACFIQHLH